MSTAIPLETEDRRGALVARMRREFDHGFTLPQLSASVKSERMIAIQLANQPFLIRSDQLTGLAKARCIVPLPSRISELLGLTAIRGTLVPVFNIGAILGLQPCGSSSAWLALAGRESPLAFAFDEFNGQVEVPQADLFTDESNLSHRFGQMLAHMGDAMHPVIDIPSLVEIVRNRGSLNGLHKE